MTSKLLVLTVLLALGTGLVGGLIGVAIFSGNDSHLQEEIQSTSAKLDNLASAIKEVSAKSAANSDAIAKIQDSLTSLNSSLAALEQKLATTNPQGSSSTAVQTGSKSLSIAYIDLSGLVDEIFQPMKNTLDFKTQELDDLRKQHDEGKIDDDTYKKRTLMVEAELAAVPINWYISLIKKRAACQEFADVKESLEGMRDKISSLKDKVAELKSVAEKGDLNTFLSSYQSLSSTLQQLDQLMTQITQALLVDVASRIAKEKHYSLVLQKQNVLYLDEQALTDITPLVKNRVPELFQK